MEPDAVRARSQREEQAPDAMVGTENRCVVPFTCSAKSTRPRAAISCSLTSRTREVDTRLVV